MEKEFMDKAKENYDKFTIALKESEKVTERVYKEHKQLREENEQMKIELDEIKSALATLGKAIGLEVKKDKCNCGRYCICPGKV